MKILQKIFILLGSIALAGLLTACGNPGTGSSALPETGSPKLTSSDVLATMTASGLGFIYGLKAIGLNDGYNDGHINIPPNDDTPDDTSSIDYSGDGFKVKGTVTVEGSKTTKTAKVVFTELTLFKNITLTGSIVFTMVSNTADPNSITITLKSDDAMSFTNGFATTVKIDTMMKLKRDIAANSEKVSYSGVVVVDGDTFQFDTIMASYSDPINAAESIINEAFLGIINGIDTSIPDDKTFTAKSNTAGTITISGSKVTQSNGDMTLTIGNGILTDFELGNPSETKANGTFAMRYVKTGTNNTLTIDKFAIELSIDSTPSSIAGSGITVNLKTEDSKLKATGYSGSITINGLAFPLDDVADVKSLLARPIGTPKP